MSVISFPGPADGADGAGGAGDAAGAGTDGQDDAGAVVLPMADHVARRAAEVDAHLTPERLADIAWIDAVAARIAAEFAAGQRARRRPPSGGSHRRRPPD